jgi:DNA-3-methyladenine glycosylase II
MLRKGEQAMTGTLRIPVPAEFAFLPNLAYLSRSSDENMYVIRDRAIYKAIPFGGRQWLIEVSEGASRELSVRFPIEDAFPEADVLEKVTRYIRDWFDLDTDLAPFYAIAREDDVLRDIVSKEFGLRGIGMPDLFETLCWGILGQQITLSFAYTLKKRFVESFGHSIAYDGMRVGIFPDPALVASLSTGDLTTLQITTKKAEYMIGVAERIADGRLSKEGLLAMGDFKAMEKELVAIRGIGPWTAHYVLMRCLRFPSAFPVDDVGLQNAIKTVLGMDRKPTVDEIRKLAAGWTGWEAYATFYLWRVLY